MSDEPRELPPDLARAIDMLRIVRWVDCGDARTRFDGEIMVPREPIISVPGLGYWSPRSIADTAERIRKRYPDISDDVTRRAAKRIIRFTRAEVKRSRIERLRAKNRNDELLPCCPGRD